MCYLILRITLDTEAITVLTLQEIGEGFELRPYSQDAKPTTLASDSMLLLFIILQKWVWLSESQI
jgi:hypothetical protein